MTLTRRTFTLQGLAAGAAAGLGSTIDLFAAPQTKRSGNPILEGWYADPEVRIFENRYWIYPTYSAPYNDQTFFDAFSSTDLVTWTKHPRILDTTRVTWANRAVWAPTVVKKGDWYYIVFGANDIQNDQQKGGLGIARHVGEQAEVIAVLEPHDLRLERGLQAVGRLRQTLGIARIGVERDRVVGVHVVVAEAVHAGRGVGGVEHRGDGVDGGGYELVAGVSTVRFPVRAVHRGVGLLPVAGAGAGLFHYQHRKRIAFPPAVAAAVSVGKRKFHRV